MKKRVITAVSAAVCSAMFICACSSAEEDPVFTGETVEQPAYQAKLDAVSPEVYTNMDDLELEPGTYISVIGKTEGTPYWNQIKNGVQQAADDINEKLGYSGDDKIKVLFNAPSNGEDIDEQVNILDEEMSRYPDVIAIASIDQNSSAVQFDLAISNGIPIVAFDSDNSYQEIQCTCMTDNTAAAADGAARLCDAIGNDGEVMLIVQDSVSGNAKERAAGFQDEISANHTGVTIVETIYMDKLDELKRQAAAEELGVSQEELETWITAASGVENNSSDESSATNDAGETKEEALSDEAKTKLEDIDAIAGQMSDTDLIVYYMEKHPDLKGCFATNGDSLLLGADAVSDKEAAETITLMGFDTGEEQIKALEEGTVDGLVVQNPFGMGYAVVVAAARTVLEIGNEARVDTGYVWVDRDNMENESIKEMLYE